MQIKKEFVLREIAGDYVLIPIGKTGAEFKGLFPLTETAAAIWEMLPGAENEEEIINKLLEEYDVDHETLATDVKGFLNKLREFGMI